MSHAHAGILFLPIAALLASSPLAQTCATDRVSLSVSGEQGNQESVSPSISADGRFVAFQSRASNLVPNDLNASRDVFVRDRLLGTTVRASLSSLGLPGTGDALAPRISADAHFVAFWSAAPDLDPNDLNLAADVFVRDLSSGTTERISLGQAGFDGDNDSTNPAISGDGRFVAFQSVASNLVPNDTNNVSDVFVRDRLLGTTTLVSVSLQGSVGSSASFSPEISNDGRLVLFRSYAGNLVPNDTNGAIDVFVRDLQTGVTERVDVSSTGAQADLDAGGTDRAGISDDGRWVVFSSRATNLVHGAQNPVSRVYLRDRTLGTTTCLSLDQSGAPANAPSTEPTISADGRFVAFTSLASLGAGDINGRTDVYVWNAQSGTLTQASVSNTGTQPTFESGSPSISADGRVVAFASLEATLVIGDTNGVSDVFVRDCADAPIVAECFGTATACPCGNAGTNGAGCENSFSTGGAKLTATGSTSVAGDTLQLEASGLPPTSPVLFFQGTSMAGGGLGIAFGDGLRCAFGTVIRLGAKAAAGGDAVFGAGVAGDPLISVQGSLPADGGLRTYQAWYRNAAPFCTSATFNWTNGLRVTWIP
jgi:Tol biopolymer transport system component